MKKAKELLVWAEKKFPARPMCHHFFYVDGPKYLLVLSVAPANVAIDFPDEDINRPLADLKKDIVEVFNNFNQAVPKRDDLNIETETEAEPEKELL